MKAMGLHAQREVLLHPVHLPSSQNHASCRSKGERGSQLPDCALFLCLQEQPLARMRVGGTIFAYPIGLVPFPLTGTRREKEAARPPPPFFLALKVTY